MLGWMFNSSIGVFSLGPRQPAKKERDNVLIAEDIWDFSEEDLSKTQFSTDDPNIPTFRMFAKLPVELRLHIWELSMPERRGREVGLLSQTIAQSYYDGLPAQLWVNNESRRVVLSMHKYTIRDDFLKQLFPRQTHHFEYIVDYELDTFVFRNIMTFLQSYHALNNFEYQQYYLAMKAEFEKIFHLKVDAIDPTPNWFSSQIEENLRSILQVFTSLKSLCFVLHMQIGDTGWAEMNLESARGIGFQFLEEYRDQKQLRGISWQAPTMKIEIVEIP